MGYWILWLAIPVFTCCKILQAIFPYVILGYLLYNEELLNVDIFQLVMLFTYIFMQLVLLILGTCVCRVQYWLWLIEPGYHSVTLHRYTEAGSLMVYIQQWYTERVWIPQINKYLSKIYGNDIATVIMDYYENINIEIEI